MQNKYIINLGKKFNVENYRGLTDTANETLWDFHCQNKELWVYSGMAVYQGSNIAEVIFQKGNGVYYQDFDLTLFVCPSCGKESPYHVNYDEDGLPESNRDKAMYFLCCKCAQGECTGKTGKNKCKFADTCE